jgi:hypothetical protein
MRLLLSILFAALSHAAVISIDFEGLREGPPITEQLTATKFANTLAQIFADADKPSSRFPPADGTVAALYLRSCCKRFTKPWVVPAGSTPKNAELLVCMNGPVLAGGRSICVTPPCPVADGSVIPLNRRPLEPEEGT